MSVRNLLIAALCLLSAPAVQAATFYVATTNSSDGNPGTLNAPWQTLSFAVSQLNAGDTLYIRGGTYSSAADVLNSSRQTIRGGTSWSNPITIAGFPGEVATLQPPDGSTSISLLSSTQQYLIFQDLIIDGILGTNSLLSAIVYLSGGAHHNRFLRVEVKNAYVNGVGFSASPANSPFNELVSCKLHDNGRNTTDSNSGYGAYISTTDNLVEDCDVYNNHGEGFQFNGDISRNVIRKNRVHDNVVHACNNPPCGGGTTGAGIVLMRGNLVSGSADSVLVYDNLVYNNGQGGPLGSSAHGISVYINTTHSMIYNNTIYNNLGVGIILQYYDPSSPSILRNNIVFGNNAGSIVDCGDLTVPAGPCGGSGSGFGHFISDHNLTANPSFSNASATPPDFHLNAGSPAIGTGINLYAQGVTTDFDGTPRSQSLPFDIGAYAFPVSGGLPPCDVNQNGSTDVVDVQLCANQAIGVTPCTADINQDGICNVIDVQRVVNAALGGQCVSP